MHNCSYENEFNVQVNEISFSYERMGTKTRFEKEAKGNSEKAYMYISSFFYGKAFLILATSPKLLKIIQNLRLQLTNQQSLCTLLGYCLYSSMLLVCL